MYAVINSGGKQVKVTPGEVVRLEYLEGKVGDKVSLEDVLLVSDDKDVKVGTPLVKGAKVAGTIVEQGRGDKVTIFKFKRRKMYRRKQGHRQSFTAVMVDSIGAAKAAKAAKKE